MKALLSIFALLSAASATAGEECPASLEYKIPGLVRADQHAAQRYADCASIPWIATADSAQAKLKSCAGGLPPKRSQKLKLAIEWVDHMTGNFSACETRLKIERKR